MAIVSSAIVVRDPRLSRARRARRPPQATENRVPPVIVRRVKAMAAARRAGAIAIGAVVVGAAVAVREADRAVRTVVAAVDPIQAAARTVARAAVVVRATAAAVLPAASS